VSEHDPTQIYSVSRAISHRMCELYPEYEDEERWRGRRQIEPYRGVLFVYEREAPALGATIVLYEKVPLPVAERRWARERQQRLEAQK
jgi:hypothetical protein